MNPRRQASGRSLRAAAIAVMLTSSAAAFQQAPVDATATPPADPPGGKEAAPPQKPEVPEGWHRERLSLKRGTTKLELTGYLQEDFRHYDWEVVGQTPSRRQAPEQELRRVRIGARAQFGKLMLEGSAEPRDLPTGSRMKTLAASYTFARPFTLRAGYFKLPGSKEFNAPTQAPDFVDRSMIATRLVPERDWGASLGGVAGKFEYLVGVFKGDGSSSNRRSGTTFGSRATVDVGKGFQISGSFMRGQVEATPPGQVPVAKGAGGATATGFTFWSRPYVDGARTRVSGTLGYTRARFKFQGEYLQEREGRSGQGSAGQDLASVFGEGWSAQATYLLSGARRGSAVEPKPSVFHGGFGALELAARVERLNFDDAGDPSIPVGSGNRAANFAPAAVTAVEAGLNYWPTSFVRLQGNAIWESYNDPRIAPVPGKTGHYFSVLTRIQLMIP
jgi:phosphate-selective porin